MDIAGNRSSLTPHGGSGRALAMAAWIAGGICLVVFLRALTCGFVNLDDHDYVLNNQMIRQLTAQTVIDAFTRPHVGFWMPLTWLSLALDYAVWGLDPFGYHLTNIILHAVNTGLVVMLSGRLFDRLEREGDGSYLRFVVPAAFLAGVWWGIHPLRVESVAWITERKDVLNGLFAIASLLYYLQYVERREKGAGYRTQYLLSLGLFVCSLMTKSITVTLPVLLCIIDWYPLDRLKRSESGRLFYEKLPFFVCSAVMAAVTLGIARQSNILVSGTELTPFLRVLVSGAALFEYLRLMIMPTGIMPLHIIDMAEVTMYAVKSSLVAGSLPLLVIFRAPRGIVATALCYLVPLLPVLAFFQNGLQAFAARFSYLPAIAPGMAAAWGVAMLYRHAGSSKRTAFRILLAAGVVVTLPLLGIASYYQIGVWKSTESAWSRIIDIKPSGRAYKERSIYYLMTGNYQAALDDLTIALEYARRARLPEIFNLHAYRGETLMLMGRPGDAVEEYGKALELCRSGVYYLRRAQALEAAGRGSEASEDYRHAGNQAEPLKWLERNACE